MRKRHSPPLLLAESHERSAQNTLPKCMRPVGDGAKRPVVIIILCKAVMFLSQRYTYFPILFGELRIFV
jgi:hypothetical protein